MNKTKPKRLDDWEERIELARRRCCEVIDLDVEPPVKYTAIKCKTALSEIEELDKLHSNLLQQQREEIIKEIEGIVGEDEKIELEQPKLFQPNPEPNEYGGYSSVPFYCSLCGESEMTIQDNEVNGKYHCKCSWWTNSCGGKWIKWYDKDYAEKAILDIPSEDNIRNQLRKEIRERLKQIIN